MNALDIASIYTQLAYLWQHLNELIARNARLEARVEAMERRITNLEAIVDARDSERATDTSL